MKKDNSDELLPEYSRVDLEHGIRGKYYDDFKSGTNLVLLTPDVAIMFDDEKSVNDALRSLIKLAKKAVVKTNHSI